MFTLIDRQLIASFFKAYMVCLTSLLMLYVVVDLFTNLDDFAGKDKSFRNVIIDIGTFYGYRVAQIFDRLCEAILLLAAMFTITWMQRCNEQVPLLASGISTRRIVTPVLASAFAMLGLTVLNQEFLVPRIADKLMCQKEDPHGLGPIQVRGTFEPNGIHIEGEKASRTNREVTNLRIMVPEAVAGELLHITAKSAIYHPHTDTKGGRWELFQTTPAEIDGWDRGTSILEAVDVGHYFLHVREVDFDAITRDPQWFTLVSTQKLFDELQRPEAGKMSPIAVLFHARLTRPILGMILVVMGLSVILRDQNRNIFISAGACLGLCGLFFAGIYTCQMLGTNNLLSPAFAAWLPILLFGPLAWVLFDAVHT